MDENNFNRKYIDITNLIQKEFERNVLKYGDKIKCCKGCSQCCHQIFSITLADQYIIKKFIDCLPDEKKINLKKKAVSYINKMNSTGNSGDNNFIKPKIPCPALGEMGECTIYEARPVICRRFGPPVYDYKNPEKLFSCELNFKDGEEITDDELIPSQTIIGKLWDELKTVYNTEYDTNKKTPVSIAGAILNS